MDTSKEYIKMCEKAVEIQHEELLKGDYVVINEKTELIADTMHYSPAELDTAIWLPRQDQLQEMVMDKFKGSSLYSMIDEFDWFCSESGLVFTDYAEQFTSMEQLWLAFVMKEKYNKTWNGEDWIQE